MSDGEAEASSAPGGCDCVHSVLARALDAVMQLKPEEVGTVLALAEARRAGVRTALATAFEAEGRQLAVLSRRAFEAADRIGASSAAGERGT